MDMDKPMAKAFLDPVQENKRLLEFAHRTKRAITCCTCMGGQGEQMQDEGFVRGFLYAVEQVSQNIRTMLSAPKERFYLWLERELDPTAKFVDGKANEI